MPSPIDPTNPASGAVDLDVSGTLPPGISGHVIGVGRDRCVHSFHLHDGRVSYVTCSICSHSTVADLVAFEGSVLVYGDDSSVRQLGTEIGHPRRVDLAGHRRAVDSCPKYDPATGELHLVGREWGGSQVHVVLPAGALTRRS